jgi:hypothetical protein
MIYLKQFLYYLKKSLCFIYLAGMVLILILNPSLMTSSYAIWIFLIMIVGFYILALLYPKKTVYAKNGLKWNKKYIFKETKERKKEKKNKDVEYFYEHIFKVLCVDPSGKYKYEYEKTVNGGSSLYSAKDNKTYSKRIDKNIYLRNKDSLE